MKVQNHPRERLASTRAAIDAVRAGGMVIVVDDADRENEGDLICAADCVTDEMVAFMVRHTSGVVCAALAPPDISRLDLPPMVYDNTDPLGTAYTVSVDARQGVSTGISAADRARTLRLLAAADSRAGDLRRPGHVFPLRGQPDGVLARPGHTEAAIDLARLAGRRPAGVLAELVEDDGSMMRLQALLRFGRAHGLPVVSIADLIAYRRQERHLVRRSASAPLPTRFGDFTVHAYTAMHDGVEHLALTCGTVADIGAGDQPVLVRVHSECLTGDVLASLRCDCGDQLASSVETIASVGSGIVVYLRGHEGRGIGLAHKLRAYQLQDGGLDTVDANLEQGLPVDARDYRISAEILADLGVRRVRVMTNNPDKCESLVEWGITVVERVPVISAPTAQNHRYLRTKQERLGHLLALAPDATV